MASHSLRSRRGCAVCASRWVERRSSRLCARRHTRHERPHASASAAYGDSRRHCRPIDHWPACRSRPEARSATCNGERPLAHPAAVCAKAVAPIRNGGVVSDRHRSTIKRGRVSIHGGEGADGGCGAPTASAGMLRLLACHSSSASAAARRSASDWATAGPARAGEGEPAACPMASLSLPLSSLCGEKEHASEEIQLYQPRTSSAAAGISASLRQPA
eukprot:scaffold14233_cov21-Tisochrysis_lutea.AAC.2